MDVTLEKAIRVVEEKCKPGVHPSELLEGLWQLRGVVGALDQERLRGVVSRERRSRVVTPLPSMPVRSGELEALRAENARLRRILQRISVLVMDSATEPVREAD